MIRLDPDLVAAARQGSRAALEALVLSVQWPVFNLAMRMLANRPDAEDATQEILIKGGHASGRCARRGSRRRLGVPDRMPPSRPREEARAGGSPTLLIPNLCRRSRGSRSAATLALLTCLSRPLRAAYILGDIFELSDAEAADALEIDQAAFRHSAFGARVLW
jgi:DNA-directed RNA polymerase specialized sigma24 family protein